MSQASDLLSRGQRAHAQQFPATITIDDTEYDCATSGVRRETRSVEGGEVAIKAVTYWLLASAFETLPAPGIDVLEGEQQFVLDRVRPGSSSTVILDCVAPE